MKTPDNQLSYRALQLWARAAVAVFYRRIDVTGVERLPRDRPVVLASNHANALADIASATWWKSPPARLLFRLGGVLPIHRRRDGDTTRNVSTFASCNAALAAGQHLCIFPEGEMHDEPALLPLKTGAARIALGAAAEGITNVSIVPIGLVYEDRGRFRSRTEIHIGEPIEIEPWVGDYERDPTKAAHAVTDVLTDRLAAATVNHGSHAEARVLDEAAAIVLADAPGEASYARRNEMRRALARAVDESGGEAGDTYRSLQAAIQTHVDALDELQAPSLDAALDAPPPGLDGALRRDLVALAPFAALGVVANAPTLLICRLVSRRVHHDGWQATVKGVGGTFLSPVVWTAEYALLARRLGRRRAFALTAAGAYGGWIALKWNEDLRRLQRITWQQHAAKARAPALEKAQQTRRDVIAGAEELLT